MISKTTTTLLLAMVGLVSAQDYLAQFGGSVGDFNKGFCLAFQNDPTDTTTTCYQSCSATADYVLKMFDKTTYTDGTFNTADLLTKLQDMNIKLLSQFKDCKTTEFFFAIDNRLSDLPFTYGTIMNVGTQVGTALGYYFGAMALAAAQTSGEYQTYIDMLNNLYANTAISNLITNAYAYFSAGEYEKLGTLMTSFLLSIVRYSAPNVSTGRSTV